MIVTNKVDGYKLKPSVTLIELTSLKNENADETVRVKMFLNFILHFLGRASKNRQYLNCGLNSDTLAIEKQKETEDIINSVS